MSSLSVRLTLLLLSPRVRRRLALAGLLVTCVIAGALLRLWLVGLPESIAGPLPPPETALGPEAGPPRPRPMPGVRSFAPPDHYPLETWTLDSMAAGAGHVQVAVVAGSAPGPLEAGRPLALEDTILLSGWAGDAVLGLRFTHVLFSLCGKVVGAAPVDRPRPEVAQYVNPNLVNSGWEAQLRAAHLPRCPEPVLEVWAARYAGFLYPLAEQLPLAPPTASPPLPPEPGAAPLRPGDLPAVESRLIRIDTRSSLHTCPRLDCPVVGSLPRGVRHAAFLERRDGWSLAVIGDQAGWMADNGFVLVAPSP